MCEGVVLIVGRAAYPQPDRLQFLSQPALPQMPGRSGQGLARRPPGQIPTNASRASIIPYDKEIYTWRHLVENLFQKIKQLAIALWRYLEHGLVPHGALLSGRDRKSTRLNSSHSCAPRMPS